MKYYYLQPETVGVLGDMTAIDPAFHPEIVTKLHWLLDWWNGDPLVELYPCWIVTKDAKKQIEISGLSGVSFCTLFVTPSDEYKEWHPNAVLPSFVWMKVDGSQGESDFGVSKSVKIEGNKKHDYHEFTLVVSQQALDLLQTLGMSHASVEAFPTSVTANQNDEA